MANFTLIIGGARSGKSARAISLAFAARPPFTFIATAEAHDDEMLDRIRRHQAERPEGWRTVEAPLQLAAAIAQIEAGTVVVDCCTLWLSNTMLANHDIEMGIVRLIDALAGARAQIILVTNEVGSGIVPESALGRRFRDEQGRLNQQLAQAAHTVELVVAGLPLRLKG